jgi:hypothetical protein
VNTKDTKITKNTTIRIGLAAVMLVGACAVPERAWACSCVLAGLPVEQRVEMAAEEGHSVFEATVSSVWRLGVVRVTILRDVKAWFGTPGRMILQMGTLGMCDSTFIVGRRYLIDGRGRLPGIRGTNVCLLTRPIDLSTETLDYLNRTRTP